MKRNFLITLFVLIGLAVNCLGGERQEESLDPDDLYVFGFQSDEEKGEITFDVKVKTKGFVGFGIAPKAGMKNADIVIGGVTEDGKPYFKDYHSVDTVTPTEDAVQNWELLEASENETHTYLKFKRLWDTCDPEGDMIIGNDTLNVIWSFGETDNIVQHTNRGGRQFLLLDPPEPVKDIKEFVKWEIRVNDTVPSVVTSYLCSFHKLAQFETKHHIVGVEAFLENTDAVRHTHHFTVTTCRLPHQEDMEQYLNQPGRDCFGELLWIRPYCNEVLFGWAVGGKRIMLPEHVGVPVGDDDPGRNQYIMLEVHYENPTVRENVTYTTGFDTYYTDELREYEGSLIMIGQEVNPSLLIPPQVENYVIGGHCSSDVTRAHLPKEGVKIIGVNLHSHTAGRKMKLRHFRDGKELPYLLNDENYDFDYQQTRILKEEIDFLPGDHLTNECVFETTDRKVITIGGESTTEEMCHAYILYYPRIELRGCKSYFPLPLLFKRFGIEEIDLEHGSLFDPTITKPDHLAGKNFSTVLNALDWTDKLKKEIQMMLRYHPHQNTYVVGNHEVEPNITTSRRTLFTKEAPVDDDIPFFTGYPTAIEYRVPESDCKTRGNNGSGTLVISSISVLFSILLFTFNH